MICCTCKDDKASTEFNKNQGHCRECSRAYYRANSERHKANVRRRNKEYTNRAKRYVLEYLSMHPCVDCGETDTIVLDFDHVRGVKIESISRLVRNACSMSLLQDEMAKCEVRCANCHRRVTHNRRLRIPSAF